MSGGDVIVLNMTFERTITRLEVVESRSIPFPSSIIASSSPYGRMPTTKAASVARAWLRAPTPKNPIKSQSIEIRNQQFRSKKIFAVCCGRDHLSFENELKIFCDYVESNCVSNCYRLRKRTAVLSN